MSNLIDDKPTSLRTIKAVMARANIAPRKSLGQNFLVDENILQKIVNAGKIEPRDLVLEIGPGLGALTKELAQRAGKVIAVEYDRELYRILKDTFGNLPNLTLLNQDILQTPLTEIMGDFPGYPMKVMANLPYYITTPVIFLLLEARIPWESMVFLVQKEVADRLTATPGTKEYGALTVMINYYGRVERITTVPKTVFYPVPQVDSTVVRITPEKSQNHQTEYDQLRHVVQLAFGQRRKTLLNTLSPLADLYGGRNQLAERLNGLQIDPGRRGETLSLSEFLTLARDLWRREQDLKEKLR